MPANRKRSSLTARQTRKQEMGTYFAPPERTGKKDLIEKIEIMDKNPVMTGLLHSISGLLAVLDEHRQIVALNKSLLTMLGIEDASEALGLRPGEAIRCVHAHREPAGCGTSKYCSTCGAAIAIVTSLKKNEPVERTCALTANKGDTTVDLALLVRSHPISIEQKRFLLLFLQDITVQQQRASLERTFFHDINNMLGGLVGASEQLYLDDHKSPLVKTIFDASLRMKHEIEIQRCLLEHGHLSYQPTNSDISPQQVIGELKALFARHQATQKKYLDWSTSIPLHAFKVDQSLLLRVLCNMITNALEATGENCTVKVWCEYKNNSLSFSVWNDKEISADVARRIFQRNFSTKEEAGRGIGTYSMKLFGETLLGGKVSFTTSPEGTTFTLSLPC